MLCVVETLKEFRTMILGYPITIHTDHKNWVHDSQVYSNARIMRWCLAIEEFAPSLKYIPGEKNIIADALSRLPFTDDMEANLTLWSDELLEVQWDERKFYEPLTLYTIHKAQLVDQGIRQLKEQVPHRLGTITDDTGQKEREEEVITLKDPITGVEHILVPASVKSQLLQ